MELHGYLQKKEEEFKTTNQKVGSLQRQEGRKKHWERNSTYLSPRPS